MPPDRDAFPPDERERAPAGGWLGPVETPTRTRLEELRDSLPRLRWPAEPSIAPMVTRILTVAGCLRRLVVLIIFLVVLALLAFFGVFGGGIILSAGSPGRAGDVRGSRPALVAEGGHRATRA